MNKILVTGGTGFIGSHTVVELFEAGYEPILIDNFDNSERKVLEGIKEITGRSFNFYEGDCNDKSFMGSVFATEKDIKGVIHFAAHKAVGESVANPLKYYRNNVGSLVVLLDVMAAYKVTKMVFSSSCTVYGQAKQLPVTEATPVLPAESPYGNTKQIGEEILRDTTNSGAALQAILLRYFNPIGAHPTAALGELPIGVPNNLVPFITQTAAGLRSQLSVFGSDYDTLDGTCIRDYIHVVDLAKAHVKAIQLLEKQEDNKPFCDIFNAGMGKGYTVLEVIKTFEAVSNTSLNYIISPRRNGDVEKIYADVSKSNRELAWETAFTLADGLRDAWRWQQKLSK